MGIYLEPKRVRDNPTAGRTVRMIGGGFVGYTDLEILGEGFWCGSAATQRRNPEIGRKIVNTTLWKGKQNERNYCQEEGREQALRSCGLHNDCSMYDCSK